MKQVGTISISSVPAITAAERLIALSVDFPEAVAGFVKSMKDGEMVELRAIDETFDTDSDPKAILFALYPTEPVKKFIQTLETARKERETGHA